MYLSFYFKLCPPGVPGADDDGLEDTQEAGGANGHVLAHCESRKQVYIQYH